MRDLPRCAVRLQQMHHLGKIKDRQIKTPQLHGIILNYAGHAKDNPVAVYRLQHQPKWLDINTNTAQTTVLLKYTGHPGVLRYPGSVYNAKGRYMVSIFNSPDLPMGMSRIPLIDIKPRISTQPSEPSPLQTFGVTITAGFPHIIGFPYYYRDP